MALAGERWVERKGEGWTEGRDEQALALFYQYIKTPDKRRVTSRICRLPRRCEYLPWSKVRLGSDGEPGKQRRTTGGSRALIYWVACAMGRRAVESNELAWAVEGRLCVDCLGGLGC